MRAQAWAVAENENGNTDQARALFRRATEAQPESVPAWQVVSVFFVLRASPFCEQMCMTNSELSCNQHDCMHSAI